MSDIVMGSDLDAMVQHYLDELVQAMSRLPASRREHLVGEIRQHIAELRRERPVRDRSDMEALLNRVGLPEDIAAVALEDVDESALDNASVSRVAPAPTAARWRLGLSNRLLAATAAGAVIVVVVVAGLVATDRSGSVARNVIVHPIGVPGNLQPPTRIVSPIVPVPNVIGSSQADVEAMLSAAGLVSSVRDVVSPNVPAGTVVAQSPDAGTTVHVSQDVTLIISSGAATATS